MIRMNGEFKCGQLKRAVEMGSRGGGSGGR